MTLFDYLSLAVLIIIAPKLSNQFVMVMAGVILSIQGILLVVKLTTGVAL